MTNSSEPNWILEECIQEGILFKDDEDTWRDTRCVVEDINLMKEPYKWICAIEKIYTSKETNKEVPVIGTGFMVKGHPFILTARHNLNISKEHRKLYKFKRLQIRFPCHKKNEIFPIDIDSDIWQHYDIDLGAIRIPLPTRFGFEANDGIPLVKFLNSDDYLPVLRKDTSLLVCGYPGPKRPTGKIGTEESLIQDDTKKPTAGLKTLLLYGTAKKVASDWPVMIEGLGLVSWVDYDDDLLYHKVDTEGGNSGSPVLVWSQGSWRAVAVHVAGDSEGKCNSSVLVTEESFSKIKKWREGITKTVEQLHIQEAVPFFNDSSSRSAASAPGVAAAAASNGRNAAAAAATDGRNTAAAATDGRNTAAAATDGTNAAAAATNGRNAAAASSNETNAAAAATDGVNSASASSSSPRSTRPSRRPMRGSSIDILDNNSCAGEAIAKIGGRGSTIQVVNNNSTIGKQSTIAGTLVINGGFTM